MSIIDISMSFLVNHFDEIRREGGNGYVKLPYSIHPIMVVKKIWSWKALNNHNLCLALLHDCLEDSDKNNNFVDYDKFKKIFGDDIAEDVKFLSFYCPSGISEKEKSKLKVKYLETFKNAGLNVLIVKIADRMCNVEDYMCTKPKYTKSYWLKARVLIETFYFKKDIIISSFSDETFNKIHNEIVKFDNILYVN